MANFRLGRNGRKLAVRIEYELGVFELIRLLAHRDLTFNDLYEIDSTAKLEKAIRSALSEDSSNRYRDPSSSDVDDELWEAAWDHAKDILRRHMPEFAKELSELE